MPTTEAVATGERILGRADELAAHSEREGMLLRSSLTPQHRAVGEKILGWMQAAGMEAHFDALGNVVGRYAGATADAPLVITGSHMDSVVDAGRYDGIFGILSAIACVESLNAQGKRLPFAIEVVAFGDEEGVRFGTSMMGSKALAGRFDAQTLEVRDGQGMTLRDALRSFGGDPDAIPSLRRDPASIRVVVETHIEQGPVLLDEGFAVGVVTAISGSSRAKITLQGQEGHAGTVPMALRHDALAAAAEMVLALEHHCLAASGRLVGTVGRLAIPGGGAINVIPGRVEFTVDIRSGEDAARQLAVAEVRRAFEAIAGGRGVRMTWEPVQELGAAPCDPREQERMAAAIAAEGLPVRRLPSGAGHDTMQFNGIAPLAMLFVRCGNGGISHSPRETMTAEDAGIATRVLLRYLESLA